MSIWYWVPIPNAHFCHFRYRYFRYQYWFGTVPVKYRILSNTGPVPDHTEYFSTGTQF
ncbi:hypothetical protein Hanom_Chr17g01562681 [Helianthus anomalus]